MVRPRNHLLQQVMTDARLSQKALARAVRETAAQDGVQLGTDHTSVARWLTGMTPRDDTARYVRRAISRRLGHSISLAEIGMASVEPLPVDLGLIYEESVGDALNALTRLYQADLTAEPSVVTSPIEAQAWREASLHWLIGDRGHLDATPASGVKVGLSDVEALQTTTQLFADLDNQFGGAHARTALISYLKHDVEPLLVGRHTEPVRQALFAAAAETTLLAAWMAYDSCRHGLAQRYFIQALRLAEAGGDRLLAGSVMSAMSHQATFVGRYREAAELARAAVTGIATVGTETLRSQFHAMEARALSRLGDRRACDLAMADAVRHFERRNPGADPAWIGYFDDAELAAELGHCHRDLGRAVDAVNYAGHSLSPDGSYVRSDFFATMVLADSHACEGEIEQACLIAGQALDLGRTLRSMRCESYLTEFRTRLNGASDTPAVEALLEAYQDHLLWIAATAGGGA